MGILNVTPDSFYDGGRYRQRGSYLEKAAKMLEAGADIIDIGGLSTRPGSEDPGEEEELERVLPVLRNLRQQFPAAILSIDTYRSAVARAVIGEGADMINDISGGTFDVDMFNVVAGQGIAYVLMHIRGTPRDMQHEPNYTDGVQEMMHFLSSQARKLESYGQTEIIIDPGFGFGKTADHNYRVLKHLADFRQLGHPIMAGLSRKSMITKVLNTNPADALNGTTVLNTLALLNGADILRVHDVREARETIALVGKFLSLPGG